jgi:NAD-dependent dihydropyrimidine dehydrogenase PreA subunit
MRSSLPTILSQLKQIANIVRRAGQSRHLPCVVAGGGSQAAPLAGHFVPAFAFEPVVLFDALINNADRKGSHVIFETGSHHLYAIDHGLCKKCGICIEECPRHAIVWR